jgi:hypothetical protein
VAWKGMNGKKEMTLWWWEASGPWARTFLAAWRELLPGRWGHLCCISKEHLELSGETDGDRQEACSRGKGMRKQLPDLKCRGSSPPLQPSCEGQGWPPPLLSELEEALLVWASWASQLNKELGVCILQPSRLEVQFQTNH